MQEARRLRDGLERDAPATRFILHISQNLTRGSIVPEALKISKLLRLMGRGGADLRDFLIHLTRFGSMLNDVLKLIRRLVILFRMLVISTGLMFLSGKLGSFLVHGDPDDRLSHERNSHLRRFHLC